MTSLDAIDAQFVGNRKPGWPWKPPAPVVSELGLKPSELKVFEAVYTALLDTFEAGSEKWRFPRFEELSARINRALAQGGWRETKEQKQVSAAARQVRKAFGDMSLTWQAGDLEKFQEKHSKLIDDALYSWFLKQENRVEERFFKHPEAEGALVHVFWLDAMRQIHVFFDVHAFLGEAFVQAGRKAAHSKAVWAAAPENYKCLELDGGGYLATGHTLMGGRDGVCASFEAYLPSLQVRQVVAELGIPIFNVQLSAMVNTRSI